MRLSGVFSIIDFTGRRQASRFRYRLFRQQQPTLTMTDWVSSEITDHAKYRYCVHGHPPDSDEELEDEVDGGEPKNRGCGAHRAKYTKTDALHIEATFFDLDEQSNNGEEEEQRDDNTDAGLKRRKSKTKAKPKYGVFFFFLLNGRFKVHCSQNWADS
jgi:hypothetical protein